MTQPAQPGDIVVAPKLGAIPMNERGVSLRTYDDAMRFATSVVQSGLAPSSFKTAQAIIVAIQTGAELGFTPMRSLSAIVVVNGRPSLMGNAALALIRNSGVCVSDPIIDVRGEGDKREGFMRFQRKTMAEPAEVTFSVADAKRAGLWGKSGVWTQYPDAMLRWRAVGVASNLHFSDVLMGLLPAEVVSDYTVREVRSVESTPLAPQRDPLLEGVVDAELTAPSVQSPKVSGGEESADGAVSKLDDALDCPLCFRTPEQLADFGHEKGCDFDTKSAA